MTNETLSWMAGVFESEGSIRINTVTKRNRGNLLCDMVNTDREMVEPFFNRWQGFFRYVEPIGRRKGFYRWRIASREARDFLIVITPFFRTERMKAKAVLALKFQNQKTSAWKTNRSAEYIELQSQFYEEMKRLNMRGTGEEIVQ